ncbi:hypothetical protein C8R44DRAFT_879444 [Mycena epipterygia]|nr:hypothetical protein C8R44DRAFT_879444 [Mycena epipterygia]
MGKRATRKLLTDDEKAERRRQTKAASYARHPEQREKSHLRMAELRAAAKLKKHKRGAPQRDLNVDDRTAGTHTDESVVVYPNRAEYPGVRNPAFLSVFVPVVEEKRAPMSEGPTLPTSSERLVIVALAHMMAVSTGEESLLGRARLLSCDAILVETGSDRRVQQELATCSRLTKQQVINPRETGRIRSLTRVQTAQLAGFWNVIFWLGMDPQPDNAWDARTAAAFRARNLLANRMTPEISDDEDSD